MKCLVNFITRRNNGNISRKPKEIDADSIRIGRATDQEIFLNDLRIAYQHAEIILLDDAYFIKSHAVSGIKVANAITSSVLLLPGVVVQIGNHELKVIEHPDYDLAVDIEQVSTSDTQNETLKLESKLDLNHTKLNKRQLSWIGFAIIFILFFVFPLASSLFQPVKDIAKAVAIIPSDAAWKSGSIASVHHFFKNDCRTCHTDAFRQVKDSACSSCHKDTQQHAADELMVDKNVNHIACQGCHKEHNGADGMLMDSSNHFCRDCHSNLQASLGTKTDLLDVSDFGSDHGEFRPAILCGKSGREIISRIAMDKNPQEKSTLLF
ncbi:MAG: cytochrome c3 family protein, partial [Methyloprofundus sp.]|nr:cytochrome c3 family protein [Methyloprofundus sp.]